MIPHNKQIKCLNCENGLYQKDHFCNQCGQKNKNSLVTVRELIADFILNFFNLDSRLINAFKKIWKPAQLTLEYIQGKRKSHVNPARMFLITLILHLSSLLYIQNHYGEDNLGGISEALYIQQDRSKMLTKFDTLSRKFDLQQNEKVDSIKKYLFEGVQEEGKDTIKLNLPYPIFEKYPIQLHDVVELNENELLEKYEVTGFLDRLLIQQGVRIIKDVKGTVNFLIGNIIWVVLLSILFLIIVMKLLYIRRSFYLIEHLVFQFHTHSFYFIILTLAFIFDFLRGIDENGPELFLFGFFLCSVYYFIGLKRYYKQGWFKTFVKFIFLNLAHIFVITICLILVALISVFLF